LSLGDGAYRVDIDRSLIEWAGRNPNTKHDGSIGLASGTITVRDGRPTGAFTIDMTRIENRSLAGDDLQPVLIDHLMSDDFFFTARFPAATFTIRDGRPRDNAHLSAPNMDIQGELTLRGVKAGLDFAATVVQAADGTITARAQFDMDRTRWQIIYGSARFFEHLGMHLVFDHISIDVKIVAVKTD
jgi:polyisoprenoid-binding protein YceI